MSDYPFFEDWERRQAKPLPKSTKPKERLPIGINEIPPLETKEKTPAIPSVNHRGNTKSLFTDKDILQ